VPQYPALCFGLRQLLLAISPKMPPPFLLPDHGKGHAFGAGAAATAVKAWFGMGILYFHGPATAVTPSIWLVARDDLELKVPGKIATFCAINSIAAAS
jgi:hypothetical protein